MSDLVRRWLDRANEHEEIVKKYSKYWKEKGKDVDIKEMFIELQRAGSRYSELILCTEQYIDRYIKLKSEGKVPIVIANILNKEIEGR